jgi:tetratricopeptide (TPR) repeat protein
VLAIVAAGTITYWHGLSAPFVLDDRISILLDPQIRDWHRLSDVFWPKRELPTAGRPLVHVTFALNYFSGQFNVLGYRVVNLAIHLACGVLVFGIVRRTCELPTLRDVWGTRASALALSIALVWTVHPLNSEVVEYITQRTESMMALFYLATLYASIRSTTSGIRWQVIAVVCCALGMMCKESMATAPLMVVLYDAVFVFDGFRSAWRSRARLYTGLAATWAVLIALLATSPHPYSAGLTSDGAITYLLNQMVIVTRYLRLAFWPSGLVLNYGWPVALTVQQVAPYALLLIVLASVTVTLFVRRPRIGFLGLWVLITLLPASSIVPIVTEVGAERRMYVPLIGLVALAVLALFRVARKPVAQYVTVGIVVAALAALTFERTAEYASPLLLAETSVARWPSAAGKGMLGVELDAAGRRPEALVYLREATQEGYTRAGYNLGGELFNEGRWNEAAEQLELFVREQPHLLRLVIDARSMIGRARMKQGRWLEAIDQFRRALAEDPSNASLHGLLADALFGAQAFDGAVSEYRLFLHAQPDNVDALQNLAIALATLGRADEAIRAFQQAVQAAPRDPKSRANLIRALLNENHLAEADRESATAVTVMPNDAVIHDLRGRTLAQLGRLAEAERQFETALSLDASLTDARDDLAAVRAFGRRGR